ncbi:hypothetical protein GCM10010430_51310 [Kitasatospora cystarginea]|uniref:Uncharacterized protein n=2 Tax=Kitasatospora cystarginea TaxID=58350 RepID=A0ABN3EJA9_9ACTN
MGVMTAHAADYRWFAERYDVLNEAYCLTLVEGLSPEDLLDRIGAKPLHRVTGVAALLEAADEFEDGGFQDVLDDDDDDDRLFIAATEVGGWALAVEHYGHLGISVPVMEALSRGTRLVSHFRNINAVDHFYWQEDGRTRLHFEPLFAFGRDGSDADATAAMMEQAGFDLREDDDCDSALHTEAAFALAEHLTGVRLTPELLDGAAFLCGAAPEPRT